MGIDQEMLTCRPGLRLAPVNTNAANSTPYIATEQVDALHYSKFKASLWQIVISRPFAVCVGVIVAQIDWKPILFGFYPDFTESRLFFAAP